MRDKAIELGFDAVGIAAADVPLTDEFAHYEAFVREGMYGGMDYLANHQGARRALDGPGILPGARSVICVAQRYAVPISNAAGITDRIATYARGRDYHKHVRRRLRKLASFVRGTAEGVLARPLVDTAPVLERAWAARAGVGFVGKNGLLIRPGLGSFTVLGEVVTTAVLTPDQPMASRCGRCDACLRACPTAAFVRPYVLDARKCISYLTIEHRGSWGEVPEETLQAIAPRLFGCDSCQDVCPFNHGRGSRIAPGGPFTPMEHWGAMSVEDVLTLQVDALAQRLEGSPVRRVSVTDLRRNALACFGKAASPSLVEALERLEADDSVPGWLRASAGEAVRRCAVGGASNKYRGGRP